MNKQKLGILTLCFIVSAVAGGTSAYFVAEERAHNVITTSGVEIELFEETIVNETEKIVPFTNIDNALPGDVYSKIPKVKNVADEKVWLRISVEKKIKLSDGSTFLIDDGLITIDFNTTSWIDGGDGYYYYNTPLNPNEITEPLFTQVGFLRELDNEFEDATFDIKLNAQAVQVANNGTDALSATGWPEG